MSLPGLSGRPSETNAITRDAHLSSRTSYGSATVPKTSLVSDTSVTGSLSSSVSNLDAGLWSTLQGLTTDGVVPDSCAGPWVSSDDLADYLVAGTLSLVVPATAMVVQAVENPETWFSILDGETSSQSVADLESLSWVLLDDLTCSLTDNALILIQSILVCQKDGSSNPAIYFSFTDPKSASSTLPLDHTLHSYSYADILGASSDLGLGNSSGAAKPPSDVFSSDPHLGASTQAGSETDLSSASNDGLATDYNLDSTYDLLTSISSSTGLDTDLNSSLDVNVASGTKGLGGLGDCE